MKRILIAATALAAVAASPAFAGTVSFSHTTAAGTAPFTDSFTLSSFDTTLGTLTGVEIILTTYSTAEVDVFNATGENQNFTNANSSVPVTVTGPAGATTTQSLVAGPFADTADDGFNTFSGITGTATSTITVAATDFGFFENPPSGLNLAFTVSGGTGSYSGSSVPGVYFSGSATVGGTTEVIYTFDNVPEPMSMLVLGAGLAGLGVVRRRHG